MALFRELFELAEQRSFGLPYPQYVNNLRELGVTSYLVNVSNYDRRIFTSHLSALEIPGNEPALPCSDQFNRDALKRALIRTQSGLSNYPTFLSEIASAGAHFYTVDVWNRAVVYFGRSPMDRYEEIIPHA